MRNIRLEYVAGSSDKFYEVDVDGSEVRIRYGRNRTYGQSDTTKSFPTEDEAMKFAEKKVTEKIKKGYQVVAGGFDIEQLKTNEIPKSVPIQPLALEQPIYPMLAKVADEELLDEYLSSDEWVTQLKYDGDRYVVVVLDGKVGVVGRNGQLKKRELNPEILTQFTDFDGWVFDGEMVNSTLVLFDVIAAPGLADDASFDERYALLAATVGQFDGSVELSPVAATADEKRKMLTDAENDRREGIMLRDRTASYQQGRTDRLLKWKFIKEVDAVVMEVGRGGKENVVVGLYDADGALIEVGQVTSIGKGGFHVGDVIEVRYLYITDEASPRLFQPRILRRRTDKKSTECTTDQLANAVTNKSV